MKEVLAVFGWLFELLLDGLFLGAEHILTTPNKKAKSKWHWVRWVIVAMCYAVYLIFSALFIFLTWFTGRELFVPRPGLEALPAWLIVLLFGVACFFSWRTLRLTWQICRLLRR